ncbi:helix-turn-helix transcriptional regulator [Microvirga lenta]|uniref:helix-turn-helix transcriptional regulator n=1 Tax=Microvirga lenta TaxID=2881337 RepID=UPI001CFFB73A|nr:helix-turn-helix domain-containing protein [Microvirga lenta]
MRLVNHLSTSPKLRSGLIDTPAVSSAKRNGKPSNEAPASRGSERLERLLTTEDVAGLLGIAPATLIWWRGQKQGPSWIRLGRGRRSPIRYRPEAVGEYLAQMESATL